jgi:hypothetical protein
MMRYDWARAANLVVGDDVLIEVVGALRERLGSRVRDVRLTQLADQLVLRGEPNTYVAKQMAQAVILELAEQVVRANEIVVL